ncbi:hypothetical protein [Umezawaea beigongshangensis]|uniref:hypothetical protein n=1 Tax=Umezawaea beigongshangensis TaxID=2780383 RepID=UPI0018F1F668|nr:hypothetical protein [Umezawaea beigongshangensis]
MIGVLSTTVIALSLAVALWALVLVVRDRTVGNALLVGLAVLEVVLLAQAVTGVVQLAGTDRTVDGFTFVGYLIGALLVLPAAAWWSLAERTRWGTAVVLAGCLVIPVLVARMIQLWDGAGV